MKGKALIYKATAESMFTTREEINSIKVGDKFLRYKFNANGERISNGIMECTYINETRHMFRMSGCCDYPEGYIVKVPSRLLKEAFFNNCPGVEKIA